MVFLNIYNPGTEFDYGEVHYVICFGDVIIKRLIDARVALSKNSK